MTPEIFYIGMDLGGTTFKAIAVSTDGHILARVQDNTQVEDEPELVAQSMVQAIRYLQHQLASSGHLQAVGFGVPGILNLPHGRVRRSPNLPRWRNVDLRAILSQYLDVPFTIENDANAAVLGEMWQGAGRGMTHIMMLTLGTGVGGGVIIDGTILHGAHGYAGELGHTIVDPNGPLCGCGSYGCLEQFVSGTAIARMAAPYYGEVTAKAVAASARQGDAHAITIYQQVGHYLGIAGVNFANLLNPECVVIGGAVAQAFDLFIGSMQETMRKRCFAEVYDSLSIVPAACGTDAGGLGAAYQAMQWAST
ncbi:MAG: ROK family protein [bacterium]|nr:ROK family protein [bacterium]